MGVTLLALSLTNPALSEYREQILVPAVQERKNSSDVLLVSILQSLPIASSSQSDPNASGPLILLVDRTKRENYFIMSVYSTEFDYCPGNSVSRSVGKTVGIAGKFYTFQTGDCLSKDPDSN
jgi:hypothetical protein